MHAQMWFPGACYDGGQGDGARRRRRWALEPGGWRLGQLDAGGHRRAIEPGRTTQDVPSIAHRAAAELCVCTRWRWPRAPLPQEALPFEKLLLRPAAASRWVYAGTRLAPRPLSSRSPPPPCCSGPLRIRSRGPAAPSRYRLLRSAVDSSSTRIIGPPSHRECGANYTDRHALIPIYVRPVRGLWRARIWGGAQAARTAGDATRPPLPASTASTTSTSTFRFLLSTFHFHPECSCGPRRPRPEFLQLRIEICARPLPPCLAPERSKYPPAHLRARPPLICKRKYAIHAIHIHTTPTPPSSCSRGLRATRSSARLAPPEAVAAPNRTAASITRARARGQCVPHAARAAFVRAGRCVCPRAPRAGTSFVRTSCVDSCALLPRARAYMRPELGGRVGLRRL